MRELLVASTALALALVSLAAPTAPDARADTVPPQGTPATVSAMPLPTVQVDGVVWSQAVVGNTVFAGGSFSKARPAGAEPGTSESVRNNLLAFDIATGALNASIKPNVNGQILAVTKSPDGQRIYIGGQFTAVDGKPRNRIAALDAKTGAVVDGFAPNVNGSVRAIAVSPTTVYFGGDFTSVDGQARPRLAASSTAGSLLAWNPKANEQVRALVLNPDRTSVIAGGRFTTIGGAPWYGMAALDPVTGATRPWAVEQIIRTAGLQSAVMGLAVDGDSVYGVSYTYGAGGNFEGTFRARGSDGALIWLADCHGDSYSVFPMGDAVYDAGHRHYCGNTPDGYYDTNPRTYYHASVLSKVVMGQSKYNPQYRLQDFTGRPSPSVLHWYPVWSVGQYTGQYQAGWNVTGNSDYLVYGGEFVAVNGKAQQGLVRFARSSPPSTSTTAPQLVPSLTPVGISARPGQVFVGWQATFDRDNRSLRYNLYRDGTLINTQTVDSTTWRRPTVSFTDNAAGSGTRSYRVTVQDPHGRTISSGTTSVKVATAVDAYAASVLAAGPEHWFRMNDASGTALRDSRGNATAVAPIAITGGQPGAVREGGTSMRFAPGSLAATEVSQIAPQRVSVEAWIKTSSARGGRIVGFGDKRNGTSKTEFTDRHLYMDNAGYVYFGVGVPGRRTVKSTAPLNNNAWHHLVGTVGPDGLKLYVDGKLSAANAAVTSARDIMGHWRIGADTLEGWVGRPTDLGLDGQIDEVAIYYKTLTASQVAANYAAR